MARVANGAARRELLKRLAGAEMEAILRQEGAARAMEVFENWVQSAGDVSATGGGPDAA
jgi:hypothetical protein